MGFNAITRVKVNTPENVNVKVALGKLALYSTITCAFSAYNFIEMNHGIGAIFYITAGQTVHSQVFVHY